MKHATENLVSIILPIYNKSHSLKSCLDSLLSQAHRNLEIIAIDDKSSDKSYEILKIYKKKYKRLRVYRNIKHYGLAICLNRGIRRAKGAFITFMDPRDTSAKSRLKRQVAILLSRPKVVVVGTQCGYVNEKGKIIQKSNFPLDHASIFKSFLSGHAMQSESVLIHRLRLPKDILKFQQKPYPAIFSQVFLKIMAYGEAANIKTVLYYRRKHINITSQDIRFMLSNALLWLESFINAEKRPALRSLFSPLVKQA